MFGGIVYKHGKGHYGINMGRCKDYFRGKYMIPIYVLKDPITGDVEQGPDVPVYQIPKLATQLNINGEYEPLYEV